MLPARLSALAAAVWATWLAAVLAMSGIAAACPPSSSGGENSTGRAIVIVDSEAARIDPDDRPFLPELDQAMRALAERGRDWGSNLVALGQPVDSRRDPAWCPGSVINTDPRLSHAQLRKEGSVPPEFRGTSLAHALRTAARSLGPDGKGSIVLVSDGAAPCEADPCAVAGRLAARFRHVDVIGVSVTGRERDQLRCIADRGQGTYYDATTAAELRHWMSRATARAGRPFFISDTEATSYDPSPPPLLAPGDYRDTAAGSTPAYYTVHRYFEGQTVRFTAFSRGAGVAPEYLRVELLDPDGRRCDLGEDRRTDQVRDIVAAQITATADSVGCGEVGDYLVRVQRGAGAQGTVPIGLRFTLEDEVEEPGFESSGTAAAIAPRVSGYTRPVVGGSAFGTATRLEPGRWSSDVVPGEALMYRVHLEFGQSARIAVRFPTATGSRRPLVRLGLYSPMHARLEAPSEAVVSGRPGPDGSTTLLTATQVVSRTADEGPAGIGTGADDHTAGAYFIGVSMAGTEHSVEIPFTIEVEVVGEPRSGPSYADGTPWRVPTLASPEPHIRECPSERTWPSWPDWLREPTLVVGWGLALALGGVLVWLYRPRRGS